MDTFTPQQQQILEAINNLPENSLAELIRFIEYLRYKSIGKESKNSKTTFLPSVVESATSIEKDISKRDEEILESEVYAIRGWSLHLNQ